MFVSFFKTEFKNSIQMIKKTAIAYFLVILSLTAVFAAVSFLIEKDSVVKRIRTAIVIQQDDKMTAMLVRYISQMDSVKGVSEFVRTDRDTAFEMLKEDKVNVVVDLPEDFYDDVNKYMQLNYFSEIGIYNAVEFKLPYSKKYIYCTKENNKLTSRFISYIPGTGSLSNPAYEIGGTYYDWYVNPIKYTDASTTNIYFQLKEKELYNLDDYVDLTKNIENHNKIYKDISKWNPNYRDKNYYKLLNNH